ncbi:hypothetical protein A2U01_0071310, partial [Trifolium medium]|nr:hypothetical protein [Trifolium medium]
MHHVDKNDLFLMADCFPLLEELDLSYPIVTTGRDFLLADDGHHHFLSLPKLRK